jgi:hypothetical protein
MLERIPCAALLLVIGNAAVSPRTAAAVEGRVGEGGASSAARLRQEFDRLHGKVGAVVELLKQGAHPSTLTKRSREMVRILQARERASYRVMPSNVLESYDAPRIRLAFDRAYGETLRAGHAAAPHLMSDAVPTLRELLAKIRKLRQDNLAHLALTPIGRDAAPVRSKLPGATLGELTRRARPDAAQIAAAQRRLQSAVEDNQFTVSRPLLAKSASGEGGLESWLGEDLPDRLRTLRAPDGGRGRWFNAGGGDLDAELQLAGLMDASSEGIPLITSLAYRAPTNFRAIRRWLGPRAPGFRGLFGRLLEDYTVEEVGVQDLITDLYGPFHYAPAIDVVMEQYARLARVGAEIRVGLSFSTRFVGPDDKPIAAREAMQRWMGASRGLELVECERGVLIVRKVAEEVSVPLLELLQFELERDGTERVYRVGAY